MGLQLEGSTQSVEQSKGVFPEPTSGVAFAPVYADKQVGVLVDGPLEVYDIALARTPGWLPQH